HHFARHVIPVSRPSRLSSQGKPLGKGVPVSRARSLEAIAAATTYGNEGLCACTQSNSSRDHWKRRSLCNKTLSSGVKVVRRGIKRGDPPPAHSTLGSLGFHQKTGPHQMVDLRPPYICDTLCQLCPGTGYPPCRLPAGAAS